MSTHFPNQRVFRLTEIVRGVVKEHLTQLEEPITRIVISSFRKMLDEESEKGLGSDPFECLRGSYTDESTRVQGAFPYQRVYVGNQECYLVDDGGVQTVNSPDPDDNSQLGDLMGVLDNSDNLWETVIENGVITGYTTDEEYVPTKEASTHPDWEHKRALDEKSTDE